MSMQQSPYLVMHVYHSVDRLLTLRYINNFVSLKRCYCHLAFMLHETPISLSVTTERFITIVVPLNSTYIINSYHSRMRACILLKNDIQIDTGIFC